MKNECRRIQKILDSMLIREIDDETQSELMEHIVNCDSCAGDYETSLETLKIIQPAVSVQASVSLKNKLKEIPLSGHAYIKSPRKKKNHVFRLISYLAASFILVAVFSVFFLTRNKHDEHAMMILRTAWAAEDSVFNTDAVLYRKIEILVSPIDNPDLANIRWLPMVSVNPNGSRNNFYLNLSAESGETYTVTDELWFNPENKHFKRKFLIDNSTVYAIAFDGSTLETQKRDAGKHIIENKYKVDDTFDRSSLNAKVFGISPGGRFNFEKEGVQILDDDYTFANGSKGVSLKFSVSMGIPVPEILLKTYWIFRIDKMTDFIREMEWITNGESLLTIRKVTETYIDGSYDDWNLETAKNNDSYTHDAYVLDNMVIDDVSIEHMAEKSEFDTYIFAENPPWIESRRIMDFLDILSPPKRSFMIFYKGYNGRDMILIQYASMQKASDKLKKLASVKYTSSNGFSFRQGIAYKWLAALMLKSAKGFIGDKKGPSNGYFIETPSGKLIFLLAKGKLSDEDMEYLASLLKPAKSLVE